MLVSEITIHSMSPISATNVFWLYRCSRVRRADHKTSGAKKALMRTWLSKTFNESTMVGPKEKGSKLKLSEGRKKLLRDWFLQIKYFIREPFY